MKWGAWTLFAVWLLTVLQVFTMRFINPPFTAVLAWNWIQHSGDIAYSQLKLSWQPLDKISPYLRKAVLAGEDQRFLSHHGFDFKELNQAIKDIALKKGYRGASTITMQTARTVFLWPARSWVRKAAEAYYTLLIEVFWSKQRILEIYLNTVDWGSGLMGAESACKTYFHRSCTHISRPQAALLAAILPNPDKWSPTNPSAYVSMRQKTILKDMKKMPLLS